MTATTAVAGAVDLGSDTVTVPTPAMRAAIAETEVGDDAHGEDPTVGRLEALSAARLGTEAARFVPSGTMADRLALLVPLGAVPSGARSHEVRYESGGAVASWGIQLRPIADEGGVLDAVIDAATCEEPDGR